MTQSLNTRAILLLSLCLFTLVFAVENIEQRDLFWAPLHNSAHSFVQFLLVPIVFLLTHLKLGERFGLRIAISCGVCFLLGIAVELGQPFIGRDASTGDIYYNFVGICAAALWLTSNTSKHTLKRLTLRSLAFVLLASSLTVPMIGAYTLNQRDVYVPVLLDFEHNWQQRIYRNGGQSHLSLTKTPKGWPNADTTLKVEFVKTRYPGFNIKQVAKNWSGYTRLYFEVFSKLDETKNITVRIHDELHNNEYNDRFNRSVEIHPGLNQIEIDVAEIETAPANRKLQLTAIAALGIFSVQPEAQFSLYFDNIKLKN